MYNTYKCIIVWCINRQWVLIRRPLWRAHSKQTHNSHGTVYSPYYWHGHNIIIMAIPIRLGFTYTANVNETRFIMPITFAFCSFWKWLMHVMWTPRDDTYTYIIILLRKRYTSRRCRNSWVCDARGPPALGNLRNPKAKIENRPL